MKVFLCVFKDFSIAVPMDSISSLILYAEETPHKEVLIYRQETQSFYISLFCLFNLAPEKTRHGIILKNQISGENIILLSAQVDSEIEIPENKIYPIPKTFKNMRFSSFFSGIQFTNDANKRLVFLLNPDQLVQYIQKEKP